MMKKRFESENETKEFASDLANYLEPGMTVLLEGELGAGKTTFAKGVASGLGIDRIIKSPTYTLIREYQEGKFPLYHMDLYRLEGTGAEELGLDEYFESNGICLVEWASFAREEMPETYLKVNLERNSEAENLRDLTLEAVGSDYKKIIEELQNV